MTRPLLLFAVPSYQRPAELYVCVKSIAEQVKECSNHSIAIFIQDEHPTDGTRETIAKLASEYPDLIEATEVNSEWRDYSSSFKTMWASVDADWVWTFGDDDQLEPGALETILKLLPDTELEFIHVAEKGRYSGTNGLYKGTLLSLCNTFGWLEMTGFITCNITRGDALRECAESPHWKRYSKSSFVQSCALLEVLKDAPAALWDVPLVSTQNAQQTQACVDRWESDKIGERYLWIVDALELMFEEGILTKKFKRAFFRYQNLSFFDRHIVYFTYDYVQNKCVNPSFRWDALCRLCKFIENEKHAEQALSALETSRNLIALHSYLSTEADSILDAIGGLHKQHNESSYPWGYVIPKEAIER